MPSTPPIKTIRPFAAFDIDGTLIRWQLYHAIADALAKRGHIDSETYRQVRDARMVWKRREHVESFKDYEHQLVETYDALLKTLTIAQFNEAIQAVFDEYKDQTYRYTRELIRSLKKRNYLLFAISGSQTEIVEKIADYYGFDDCVGSTYERVGHGFSGEKQVFLGNKDGIIKQLVKKHATNFHDSIAVGDSAGDISMLELVEQPIAFNPEQKLFEAATKRGWSIVIERKNVIYEMKNENGRYILAQADS